MTHSMDDMREWPIAPELQDKYFLSGTHAKGDVLEISDGRIGIVVNDLCAPVDEGEWVIVLVGTSTIFCYCIKGNTIPQDSVGEEIIDKSANVFWKIHEEL